MKITKIKAQNVSRFFQVTTDSKEQIEQIRTIFNNTMERYFPEQFNFPEYLRTTTLEVNSNIVSVKTTFLEEIEFIVDLKSKIEEQFEGAIK